MYDDEKDAYNAAVNILAVEYLIKENNPEEYGRRIEQLYKVRDCSDISSLAFLLSFNMHISNLGAMITQGDYDEQKETLLNFLDERSKQND